MDSSQNNTFHRSKDKLQNIVYCLFDRERGIDRRRVNRRLARHFNEEFFKCITPNLTISNIYKPKNFFRKFSPDGKYLICFSKDLQNFENYKFLGTANAANLLYGWKTEYIPPESNADLGLQIRANIFRKLFKLNWSIQLTTFVRPLFREFSIFTDDAKYVIVASLMRVQEENLPPYYELNTIHRDQFDYDLNTYRFYMVKLSTGEISDTLEYTYDYINLSHNHGFTLKNDMLAIVSLFHQWINVLQIKDGKFIKLYTIGKFFHDTDECLCSNVPEYREECIILDTKYGGFKQKLLSKLYKDVFKHQEKAEIRKGLKQFYKRFGMYDSLHIFKAQLIDKENILIRLENKYIPSLDANTVTKLFVIYNMTNEEITNIYFERSRDLLHTFSRFFDDFRSTNSMFTGRAPSSSSNNVYVQRNQKRILETYEDSEEGAVYRYLRQFPISIQSYSVSPYLDLNLFQYEERLVSSLERPRYSTTTPIAFTDRDTGLTKFRIFPGVVEKYSFENGERNRIFPYRALSAFIFHPFEPIAISVQKLSNRFVTNIHIRNEGTIVKL